MVEINSDLSSTQWTPSAAMNAKTGKGVANERSSSPLFFLVSLVAVSQNVQYGSDRKMSSVGDGACDLFVLGMYKIGLNCIRQLDSC